METLTKKQLNKLNAKLKKLEVNVVITCYDFVQAKYSELEQTKTDTYYYQLLNSNISNTITFDDLYYSFI